MIIKAVPMGEDRNGMEVTKRHARPNELEDLELCYTAKVLLLGELEAAAEGTPAKARTSWIKFRTSIEALFHEALNEPEPTTGAMEISQSAHCSAALENLREIDFVTEAMQGQLATAEEREWLAETIAEVAHLAVTAGMHVRSVQSKPFEALAARKEAIDARNISNASKGGETRRARAEGEYRLLKSLALSDAEFKKWISKKERHQVSYIRSLVLRLSKENKADGLFTSEQGKSTHIIRLKILFQSCDVKEHWTEN
jgi:hypothetical protein